MKPTKAQATKELRELKKLRGMIPPRSAFGDDNIGKIDAQIDVLENELTENQIDYKYIDFDIHDDAIYARQWLDGEALDESMSDNWRPLAGVRVKPIDRRSAD